MFPAPVQTGPVFHPTSFTMGTGFFLGIKQPEPDVDHLPPSSSVSGAILLPPFGLSWPVLEELCLYLYLYIFNEIVTEVPISSCNL